MTTIPSAPGSPPDLSGSRSSASTSSYGSSSSPTGGERLTADITHYEDIVLDDDRPSQKPVLQSTVTERRPSTHSVNGGKQENRSHIGNQIREAVKEHEKELRKQKSASLILCAEALQCNQRPYAYLLNIKKMSERDLRRHRSARLASSPRGH
ncbi:uncharacterized protein AB675_698 [Cyphellophora attinorum]|uniref:Uncharacterized protein n=1 Tax=Cyphellophora attinorum TaxID=1664694 RepID=A0A0N0NSB9_9EURO|nr:uncharacterized protein AB675_698 [Phialophora attinorum]KPI46078.1 hypothetical protein AB675_698 [Phialophora attinorum]